MPNVAIVYDRVNKYGGAERVLEALHQAFPDAPLYTSVYNPATAPWTSSWKVYTTFLQRILFARTHHELFAWLMPLAFESLDFSAFDLVISVTSEAAKGIVTKPETTHICYMLTPTRYLWSKATEYEQNFLGKSGAFLLLPFYRLAMRYLRWWDQIAAQRPDKIIPISHVVKQRIRTYYGRDAEKPLYPPVEFGLFSKTTFSKDTVLEEPSYLVVSRLVGYKRIDLAIDACIQLKRHLYIVGTGSEEQSLKALAGHSPYIHFMGQLTDTDLVGYYQHCTALLFPGEEDFGITALEAMSAGRPAVVYAKSGNAEVVEQGKNGVIFEHQTVDEVVSALQRVEAVQWDGSSIQASVKQYDVEEFVRSWRSYGKSS